LSYRRTPASTKRGKPGPERRSATAAVAFAESAQDVSTAVHFAGEQGYRVAPQANGHSAGPLGSLEDTILLKTERMSGVRIDPEERIARVEAGVVWLDVVEAAARHGLAALAGSSPDVGVVGYTLGGGLSFLGRKHGLCANAVRAPEVVTADGRLRRCTGTASPTCSGRPAARTRAGAYGVDLVIAAVIGPGFSGVDPDL
jgi:FAD/FMN-containing dehydrogenase